jgi:predicted metalloprotease with PDZ domain
VHSRATDSSQSGPTAYHAPEMLARQPVLSLQQFVEMIRQQSKTLSESTLKVHSSATDSSQNGPTAHHAPEMLARAFTMSATICCNDKTAA